jgi:hypothetical protein
MEDFNLTRRRSQFPKFIDFKQHKSCFKEKLNVKNIPYMNLGQSYLYISRYSCIKFDTLEFSSPAIWNIM